jgi:2-polyprenyl-3-methyl-5-hydroxy-6-metoxy-1,4-benzoquinol methylase
MRYLHQRFPRWEMKGSDLSDSAIAYAQQLLPEARFAVEDIYRLSDADNAYDLVIASEVLEHLEDPAAALSEIVRTSRRYVLLSVPNEPAFQLTNFARGKYLRRWGNHPEHIQHWSRGRFAEFVSTQCHVISTSSSFPWTIVLAAKRA